MFLNVQIRNLVVQKNIKIYRKIDGVFEIVVFILNGIGFSLIVFGLVYLVGYCFGFGVYYLLFRWQ